MSVLYSEYSLHSSLCASYPSISNIRGAIGSWAVHQPLRQVGAHDISCLPNLSIPFVISLWILHAGRLPRLFALGGWLLRLLTMQRAWFRSSLAVFHWLLRVALCIRVHFQTNSQSLICGVPHYFFPGCNCVYVICQSKVVSVSTFYLILLLSRFVFLNTFYNHTVINCKYIYHLPWWDAAVRHALTKHAVH